MYKRISLFAGLLLATTVANALQITATLNSFINRSVTIQGLASGGGYGKFTVTSVTGDASDEFGDELLEVLLAEDAEFWAACLEPDEFIFTTTYIFNVDLLRNAPTSSASGPMTVQGETWMERIFDITDFADMGAFVGSSTNGQQFAMQAALYEAGYEAKPATDFDTAGGTAIITSGGIDPVTLGLYDVAAGDTALGDTNAYALINVGVVGPSTRTIYQAQDFVIFTVPEPDLVALLSLGLLGLGITTTKLRRKV